MQEIKSNDGSIQLIGGSSIPKGSQSVTISEGALRVSQFGSRNAWWVLEVPILVDDVEITDIEVLRDTISAFKKGGGSGSGAVNSVTGNLVTGTSNDPIVNLPSNVLKTTDTSMLPSAGKVPVFSPQGLISTGTPQFPENAVPLSYLDATMRGYGGLISVTSSRTLTINDVGSKALVVGFNDAILTLPENSIAFSVGSIINIINVTGTLIEIAPAGDLPVIISNNDMRYVAERAGAHLVYLGGDTWFLEGELTVTS